MIIDQNTVLLCLSFLLFGGLITYFVVKASHVPRADFNAERDKSILSANEQLNLKTRIEEQGGQLQKAAEIFSNEQQITRQQQNRISELSARQESNLENLSIQSQTIHKQQELLEENQQQLNKLLSEISKLEAYNDGLHEKLETNKSEVEEIRKKSLLEFESVANKLLEEKTAKFSLSNKENMEQILNPLKENIVDFKKKVEETYDRESKERFSLEARIKELVTLNNQISKDANNLTNALKGQAKTQGNWGEMILENILEYSGLVKNREYFLQESYTDESGKRKQPDVIIKYPGDRHIIVDSKVSLTAYERFANEEDVEAQKLYLAEHIRSIKTHIDELSKKEYDSIEKSLDFVMLFVPIEPAFMTAIHFDQQLWNYAYKKRILLISPTNLIAALKMVADIWKREHQNANAMNIAKMGQLLYEKFAGFIGDMEDVGNSLGKASEKYEQAMGKLSTGKGNLIGQAERLKKLGISTKKELPEKFLFENEELEEDA